MLDLQEMPLVEPTNLLVKKMIANGIDVSQFSVRYEYLLLARLAKARR